MARHTPGSKAQAPTSVGTGEQAPVQGGALGVPEASNTVRTMADTSVGSARRGPLDKAEEVAPKRYVITGGPQRQPGRVTVMYDGVRSDWPIGKEVTELTHDLGLLRRQGIVLQEVEEPVIPLVPEPQLEDEVTA
jgi:hypothetical protein